MRQIPPDRKQRQIEPKLPAERRATRLVDDIRYADRGLSRNYVLAPRIVGGEHFRFSAEHLAADTEHGNRPGFSNAENPAQAKAMYDYFNGLLTAKGITPQTGIFQADMKVRLINDGPATFWLTK